MIAAAAARLRARLREAGPAAAVEAAAGALGLLVLAGAADEAELAAGERLLADLAAMDPPDPPRAVLLLSLVLCRQVTVDSTEAREAAAACFRAADAATGDGDRSTALLTGAARLLALAAGWVRPGAPAPAAAAAVEHATDGRAALAAGAGALAAALGLPAGSTAAEDLLDIAESGLLTPGRG